MTLITSKTFEPTHFHCSRLNKDEFDLVQNLIHGVLLSDYGVSGYIQISKNYIFVAHFLLLKINNRCTHLYVFLPPKKQVLLVKLFLFMFLYLGHLFT